MFHKDVSITTDGTTTDFGIDASIVRIDNLFEGTNKFDALQKEPQYYSGDGTKRVYRITGRRIELGFLGEGTITALPTGLTVTMKTRAKVEDFTEFIRLLDANGDPILDLNGDPMYVVADSFIEGPEIAGQFHMAPIYKVLSELYLEPSERYTPAVGLAYHNIYQAKWDRILRTARGFSRKATGFTVTKWEF